MKWLMVIAALAAFSDFLEARIHVITRNRESSYLECQDRAVCADSYNFTRRLTTGDRQELRIINNCKCPDNMSCPIEDDHMLEASTKHKQYLCNVVETLPDCSTTLPLPSAEDMVEGDEDFEFYNYWRINCKCPRHSHPVEALPGQMERATRWMRVRPDWGRHMFIHEYVCDNELGRERQHH